MATFPQLKTGAVAQYPAEQQLRFSTEVLEFVDGREQRFSEYATSLRRWVIRLDLLDDSELARIALFFDQVAPAENFTFTDPWDGSIHPNCIVENQEFWAECRGPERNRTELTIREDRTPWLSFHN